jgi:uncharacterized protein (TIGR03546 family)
MIEMLANLLKVLNSETEPGQISLGACFALIIGFTPLYSLHNLLVLLLVLILRVNLSTFIIAWGLFSALAFLLDPLFHWVGLQILTAASLKGLWTTLYNLLLFRLARFNNTVTMGSLVTAGVLFLPLFLLLNQIIRKYREHILAWVRKTKVMQMLEASKVFTTYQSLKGMGGRS